LTPVSRGFTIEVVKIEKPKGVKNEIEKQTFVLPDHNGTTRYGDSHSFYRYPFNLCPNQQTGMVPGVGG
jgi:uncharacterized lipoprotein